MTRFKIPLEKITFPGVRGSNGQPPVKEANRIAISFAASSPPRRCIKVYGAVLRVKLMSPVILVHGVNSNGGFFVRQGFVAGLNSALLVWDNSIRLDSTPNENSPSINAETLDSQLRAMAKNMGVDSMHVVAHSKGGLDMRAYLDEYYPNGSCKGGPNDGNLCYDSSGCQGTDARCVRPFSILSFTTLSTPHNGSVLADVAVGRQRVAWMRLAEFQNFPAWMNTIAALKGNKNYESLQTSVCAEFNSRNVDALRVFAPDVTFNTTGADLDNNLNGLVDPRWVWSDTDDCSELQIEAYDEPLVYNLALEEFARLVNPAYQTLRTVREIDVVLPNPPYHQGFLYAYHNSQPNLNDIMVTTDSAAGAGCYEALVQPQGGHRKTYMAGNARNHASIADPDNAAQVVKWMIEAEKQKGDLR